MKSSPNARERNDNDWMERTGRWLAKAAAALAILLVAIQIALHFPVVRHYLTNADEWEGIPYVSSSAGR